MTHDTCDVLWNGFEALEATPGVYTDLAEVSRLLGVPVLSIQEMHAVFLKLLDTAEGGSDLAPKCAELLGVAALGRGSNNGTDRLFHGLDQDHAEAAMGLVEGTIVGPNPKLVFEAMPEAEQERVRRIVDHYGETIPK